MLNYLKSIFDLDQRSLALFRITLGLSLIFDHLQRMSLMTAFYTDQSIHDRTIMMSLNNAFRSSIYYINGQESITAYLMLAHLICLICFTLGYRTKLFQVLSFIFTVSIQNRNYMILNNGDTVLRLALLMSFPMALSNYFSLDSWRGKLAQHHWAHQIPIFLQVMMIYIFTGLVKNSPVWTEHYTASYFALMLDSFATDLGRWLLNFPQLLKFATWSTLKLEIFMPFLLLIPTKKSFLRLSLVSIFILFHLSIFATLKVGIFSIVCISLWMLFIPSSFWEKFYFPPKIISHKMHHKTLLALVVPSLLIGMYYNLNSVNSTKFPLTNKLRDLAQIIRIDQSWEMFAPFPYRYDEWPVIEGQLINGETYDVFFQEKRSASFERPQDFSQYLTNSRWQKFFNNLNKDEHDTLLGYGRWICRRHNRNTFPDNRLKSFTIYKLSQEVLSNRQRGPIKKAALWDHRCF